MNEKYVITGGPSSGKTTIIGELRKQGHKVIDEVARDVITTNPRLGPLERELEIFRRQLEREIKTNYANAERIFLDRGLLDVHAYCNLLLGYIPSDIARYDAKNRYAEVFVLDRLPFKEDGVRMEKDDDEAEKVHTALINTYQNHGYKPIHVPVFKGEIEESVKKRIEFIMESVL
ncbi:MAG TPA: ATP-binding protein [Candidatus Nanoarchaeia archaeon]|nr:ATP-binding protein [Candidatus Nanoarchaeia archaeon]